MKFITFFSFYFITAGYFLVNKDIHKAIVATSYSSVCHSAFIVGLIRQYFLQKNVIRATIFILFHQ